MNTSLPAKKLFPLRRCYGLIAAVFGCLLSSTHAEAAGTASEQANIAIMIRELNALEAVAQRSGELPNDGSQRYHFDYQSLARDIARMRQGLQDYLTPSRAQPRDTAELSGHYTTSSDH
ncbi:RAQPRD family integrative conjugative element protein [Pseudomonas sp. NPDC088368]|uniref:integrative conjugative element protein, RAQPRD family n=1 Tax=Pseudomonas sp. NPDC088368 TaxID=3364453 RepID=UPI0037F7A859